MGKRGKAAFRLHSGENRPVDLNAKPLQGGIRIQYRLSPTGPCFIGRVGNVDWAKVAEWRPL